MKLEPEGATSAIRLLIHCLSLYLSCVKRGQQGLGRRLWPGAQ